MKGFTLTDKIQGHDKFKVTEVVNVYQGLSLTYLANPFLCTMKAKANVVKIIERFTFLMASLQTEVATKV